MNSTDLDWVEERARGSQRLRVLADAGLVDVIADGTWRFNRPNPAGVTDARDWLNDLAA